MLRAPVLGFPGADGVLKASRLVVGDAPDGYLRPVATVRMVILNSENVILASWILVGTEYPVISFTGHRLPI